MNTEIDTKVKRWQEMVIGLVKDGDEILSQNNKETAHRFHMASALLGECAELILWTDADNLIEEAGDIEFYFYGLQASCGMEAKLEAYHNEHGVELEILKNAEELFNLSKKEFIYGKEINWKDKQYAFNKFRTSLNSFYIENNINLIDVYDFNYKKLGERYKGHKYTDEQAISRNDKKDKQNPDS